MHRTKILIVDDRPENIVALSNLVISDDVEVISATSGNEALEMLLKHNIALALLDVQMPVISGFELARFMRSAERSRSIPIIFVTASERTTADIFDGYEHGAVDYLTKPLDPHMVRSKIRVFVELDQKSRALQQKSEDLEQKLREVESLKKDAEAASQAKSRFLANMSHEIRSPLGAVLGFSELLKLDDQTPAERQGYAVAIERNGKLLLKLIDDILDLSKIEANRIDIELANISLTELIDDLSAVHGLKAAERGIIFEVKAEELRPQSVVSDPLRLKQILNNIIGNAIKFTSKGIVTVEIRLDPDAPLRKLRFIVTDSGCGLSKEQAERLFHPFMQADNSTTRKFGGTGLGLTIAKRLAQLLGGDVVLLHSEKGVGSGFEISINPGQINSISETDKQISSTAIKHAATKAAAPLKDIRILVVDDAHDNRILMSRILSHAGATITTAENGLEAVKEALQEPFDIIFMDVQMPIMDGYEATETLRRAGYRHAIIALTAHAMKEELDRCAAAGCNHYLSKPVERNTLIDNILHFSRARNLPEQQPNLVLHARSSIDPSAQETSFRGESH